MSTSSRTGKRRVRVGGWSGYTEPYVKTIIRTAMKGLTLLATLTFDPELLFWTMGLKKHLESRLKEAEKEIQELNKYRF